MEGDRTPAGATRAVEKKAGSACSMDTLFSAVIVLSIVPSLPKLRFRRDDITIERKDGMRFYLFTQISCVERAKFDSTCGVMMIINSSSDSCFEVSVSPRFKPGSEARPGTPAIES